VLKELRLCLVAGDVHIFQHPPDVLSTACCVQLPASALLEPGEQLTAESPQQQQQQQEDAAQERRRRLQRQKQQNSPPHMAIMEAVVSSTMCHPNVSTCLRLLMHAAIISCNWHTTVWTAV